jgi:hypothetical protein
LVIGNLDRSDDGQDQCGDPDREQHGNANQDKGQRDATKAINDYRDVKVQGFPGVVGDKW